MLLLATPASAQINFQGSIRSRVEVWDWFAADEGNPYAFSGNLIRLGISEQRKTWDWQIELAAPILLGLPEDAIRPAPQLQLGFGGIYYGANDRERNAAMLFPKQAFVRFKGLLGNDSLRLGRFEFMDGTETTPANATLAALKRDRIAHRLLGNFGFTHVGRSFDGAQYAWNGGGLNVTLVGAVPTRGVFQVDGWGNLPIAVGYGALTGVTKGSAYDGEWRLFGMYYDDTRDIVKVDNRPAALRASDFGNVRIGTFGGHYIGEMRQDAGALDVLLWGATQAGTWGSLDHRGWAFAAELGWQPEGAPAIHPWIRAGYSHSSGDDDPLDDNHGTFFQVLPTARIYARFPFYNLMNNRDAFASLILRPSKTVVVRTDLHGLWLANRNDSWYQGGGAFQPWSFGYIARPSSGANRFATLWDISADWNVVPQATLTGYFAHAWGGGVVKAIYPTSQSANLGYVEVTYRF
ncbi:MAG TPA: alginate export family protein [Bryobacteraceae bacterium]|nr:alginate export family protein [Bryobacteraceae bacterium]